MTTRSPFRQRLTFLCLLLVLSCGVGSAQQVIRTFTPRFDRDLFGDLAVTGNTLMTCPANNAACTNALAGTGTSLDNNNYSLIYADIDSDSTTFNSSAAQLTLPPGATVLWAGLYWGGSPPNNTLAATLRSVKFRSPTMGTYVNLTASQLDNGNGIHAQNPYQGFVEVTPYVQEAGSGSYTVANVQGRTGTPPSGGNYAGWSLVVVYESGTTFRSITVFDGFLQQGATASPTTITVSGFRTPASGSFSVGISAIAYEGDRGTTGDYLNLNGVAQSSTVRTATNFFNSAITPSVTSKNPNYLNQMGFDIADFNIVGGLGLTVKNSDTSATFTFGTSGDGYYPGLIAFATQSLRPNLVASSTKTVNSPSGSTAKAGDVLTYTMSMSNAGNDAAQNVVLSDTIPANTTYVPGSLTIISGPNAGSKTDALSDDQAGFDSANNQVVFRLGTGASGTAGGTLAIGASTTVSVQLRVNTAVPTGTVISNQATINGQSATGSVPFTARTDGDPNTPGQQPTTITVANEGFISGHVFEDVNYGGGAGRSLSSSSGVLRPGARVELYGPSGNFLSATTTDSSGAYLFSGLGTSQYTVRVVSASVLSSRPGNNSSLLGVQTFRTDASSGSAVAVTTKVGGEQPRFVDAAANTTSATLGSLTTTSTTAQSITTVNLASSTSSVGNVDFGFNFDTIVSTRDAGQGSLRQFILNSNALTNTGLHQVGQSSGREVSIFMIPTATDPLGRPADPNITSGAATITALSTLPAITGSNTSVDGSTQTTLVGNSNAGSTSGVSHPEVQLRDGNALELGLDVQANGVQLQNFAIYGFGNSASDSASADIRIGSVSAARVQQLIVGSAATGFTDPGGTSRSGGTGILTSGSSGTVITQNLIGFASGSGLWITGGSSGVQVSNSVIRANGQGSTAADGVTLDSANGTGIVGNTLESNRGSGIEVGSSVSSTTIRQNTITGNGIGGAETAGVRLLGTANSVLQNTIASNAGAGVLVTSSGASNTLSQNSTYGNGQLGIDLLSNSDNGLTGSSPYVTPNDPGDPDTGGNDLLNFPILETAVVVGGTLVVSGFARSGSLIEFFVAEADPTGFGEGRTYLFSRTEGSGSDLDSTQGSYSGTVNGLHQGSDTTARFRFSLPLPSGIGVNTLLTSTATLTQNTSEFSGNVRVAANAGSLTLSKQVRNVTQGGSFATSAPGRPGDTLEYCVAYANPGDSQVTGVTLSDTIPQNTAAQLAVPGSPYNGNAIVWQISSPTSSTLSLTAASDSDAGALGAALTVTLGTVPAGGTGNVCFRVVIR